MPEEAVVRNVFEWVDKGVKGVVAGALKVEQSQLDVADANKEVARSAAATDAVFTRTAGNVAATAQEYEHLAETMGQVSDVDIDPKSPKKPRKGGDSADIGNVDTATSALGTLASSLDLAGAEALGVAGDVFGLADAIGPLIAATKANVLATTASSGAESAAAVSAGTLTVALLPWAALFGGLAVVAGVVAGGVAKASAAYEENREAATVAAGAITEYNRAIAEGTSVDIAAQLDQANTDLEVASQTRTDLLAAQTAAWDRENATFIDGIEFVGDATARLRTLFGTTTQGADKYNEAIEAQEQAVIEARSKVDGLTRAMDSAAVATNDAAQAQEDATAATVEALQTSSDLEIERARTLRSASEESVAAAIEEEEIKLTSLQRQREALLALDQESQDVIDALAATDSELASTSETFDFLSTSASDAAEANDLLARSEQRLAEVARETDAALSEIEGADESIIALQERITENERKGAEQRVDLSERLASDLDRINERVAADAKSNAKRIASIEAAAVKDDIALTEGVIADETKARAALVDFNSKQTKATLKDEARTIKDIGKLRANARKEEARAEEDLALGLQEVALSRNVDALIGLQRAAEAEASQREEDVAAEISERQADAAERTQEKAADRAERQAEANERITEIRALAAEERTAQQVEARAAIADEQVSQQERAALRDKEFANAEVASEKRATKLGEQNARALMAIEEQVNEEIAIKTTATKEILALEGERAKITAGGIDNVILAEDRLLERRRAAIDGLNANTTAFEQNTGETLNSIAINFGDIATTVVTDLSGVFQDVVNIATANIARNLTIQMQGAARQLGV